MSVPPEIMQRMMGAGGGAPQAGAAQPPQPGQPGAPNGPGQMPGGSPMSKPQDKKGLRAAAGAKIQIAASMLEQALPELGQDEEAKSTMLQVLTKLYKMAGGKKDSSDLVPAEVLQMNRSLPQMGGGTAVQQAIMKQMAGQQHQPQQAA